MLGEPPGNQLIGGQVGIEIALTAINPSDLLFRKGEYGQPRRRGVSQFIIALARYAGIPMIAVARGDVHNETLRELGVTAIMNQAICGFWLTPRMTETSHEATFHGKPGRR
ncbi:hypothetical protein N9549_05800 [Acidimicrobiales bacterium]|nr:hypothetical protein [Acidimicrobiaceae bacterium]MDB4103566.1 hypothetical protein [Acidimicrobiales bacterium]